VDVVERTRLRIAGDLREIVSGSSERAEFVVDPDTPRLFAPGSAPWIVQSDVAMLVGGIRALLIQTLHPLVMAGVADHSDFRNDPLGRLQRTSKFVGVTTFGTLVEAEAAIATVRRVHDHITGHTPDGRPYEANDPHLLAWVHATEVDSFLRARHRYGTEPLAKGIADQYVADMGDIATRLGVIDPPRSTVDLSWALERFRPELEVGQQAHSTVRWLAAPPAPLPVRVPYAVLFSAAVALLPRYARRMLRLPVPPLAGPVFIEPAATGLLRILGWAMGTHPSRNDL
jgi:uncharacterized protein (DUF2236 family)